MVFNKLLIFMLMVCHQLLQAGVELQVSDKTVSHEEAAYTLRRKKRIDESFAKQFGLESSWRHYLVGTKAPRVALCFSGGGCRAMLQSLGALKAAQNNGLLDLTTYMSSLSGSTWALMPWLASDKTLDEYISYIQKRLSISVASHLYTILTTNSDKIKSLKGRTDAGLELNDIYASLLLSITLRHSVHNPFDVTLADIAKKRFAPECSADVPYPFATAVSGGSKLHHHWFEFSPFSFGHSTIGHIPSNCLGNTFVNGIGVKQHAQPKLAYLMGMWGSAYAVDGLRLLVELGFGYNPSKNLVINTIKNIMPSILTGDVLADYLDDARFNLLLDKNHFAPAVRNPFFAKKKPGFINHYFGSQTIELAHVDELPLVDGAHDMLWAASIDGTQNRGFAMNLGIVPLLHPSREVDVIIAIDSSGDLDGAPSLVAAQLRAQELGLPFPKEKVLEQSAGTKIRVLEGDANTPTIIYVPCLPVVEELSRVNSAQPDSDYAATTNFSYSHEHSAYVIKRGQVALEVAMPVIKHVIFDRYKKSTYF